MGDYDQMLKLYLATDSDLDELPPDELKTAILADRELTRRVRQFVLDEGSRFEIQPFPAGYNKQPAGECVRQSLNLSVDEQLTYVEGFALSPIGTVALHHAWCEDSQGGLVDLTWANRGLAYFGVRFRRSYVLGWWEANKNTAWIRWSLLADHRNHFAVINRVIDDWQSIAQDRS